MEFNFNDVTVETNVSNYLKPGNFTVKTTEEKSGESSQKKSPYVEVVIVDNEGKTCSQQYYLNTAVGEGCIDVMTCGNLTATVGANQTQNYNILLGVGLRGTQSTEPSNSTPITMSWTLSGAGGVWAIGAVNVLPPAAPVDVDTMSWRPTYPNMIDHWRTYEIVGSGNASS